MLWYLLSLHLITLISRILYEMRIKLGFKLQWEWWDARIISTKALWFPGATISGAFVVFFFLDSPEPNFILISYKILEMRVMRRKDNKYQSIMVSWSNNKWRLCFIFLFGLSSRKILFLGRNLRVNEVFWRHRLIGDKAILHILLYKKKWGKWVA